MIDLGIVKPGSTIRIPFSSYDKDDGSSISMTNFATSDILIYKDGSTTERASTAGFTATTDFDSKTGKHLAVIDLADNTTAGFYNAGSEYLVAIDAVTVDSVTTGGWIARFRIGYDGSNLDTTIASLSSQTSFTLTAGPAEDDALNGCVVAIHDIASAVQMGYAVVSDYTGSSKTVTLTAGVTFTAAAGDNISVFPPGNARWFAALLGSALPLTPTTAGRTLDVSAGGEAGIDWANVGSPTTTVGLSGTTVKTATDVETDTADIQSRIPAALVGGKIDANMGAISGDSTAADNLETLLDDTAGAVPWIGIIDQGTAQSATGTTLVLRAAAGFANDELIGATIVITGGSAGVGQSRTITDYVGASDTATVDAWTTTPTGTITYKIYGTAPGASGSGATAAEVWAYSDRQLTALDEDVTTIDLNGSAVGSVVGAVGSVTGLTASDVAAIKAKTDNLPSDPADESLVIAATDAIAALLGTPAGASVSADVAAVKAQTAAIETDTAEIGAAGAGLTALATQASVNTIDDFLDTEIAAIKAKTDQLTFTVANQVDANALTVDEDEILDDQLADSVPADGTLPTVRQALYMLTQFMFERSVSGTTVTVAKADGTTALMTFTLNDGTSPTSITRAT